MSCEDHDECPHCAEHRKKVDGILEAATGCKGDDDKQKFSMGDALYVIGSAVGILLAMGNENNVKGMMEDIGDLFTTALNVALDQDDDEDHPQMDVKMVVSVGEVPPQNMRH